jgi:hypothetical protein
MARRGLASVPNRRRSLYGSQLVAGGGFSEDVPLFPEGFDLTAEPAHFLPLLGGQTVGKPALIGVA